MKIPSLSPRSGVTLVELMVAVGIVSLMFGAIGYLSVMTARNTALVSQQALSQNNASAAAQRIATLVRNASGIRPVAGDDINTSLSRIMFDQPFTGKTGVIAFAKKDENSTDSNGVIKIFLDSDDYSAGSVLKDKADYAFEGIQNFQIGYRTSTWMTLSVFYSYKSYMNFASHDNDYGKKLAGEFVTDVIAKNHHPGESAKYGETTTSLFLL